MRAWLRENRKSLLGFIPVVLISLAIGWVIWVEMGRWYSTTHVENMVGQVWEVRASDSALEIEVLFTETTHFFTYEGALPDYVTERQYVRALFQFSPDNDCILEFIGPVNPPGLSFPTTLFAILGVIIVAAFILYVLTRGGT